MESAAVRTGDDTRRRGWFWHWNSIVTQYDPLIGLKGVGLLNSYTVWTDRRESSPMRGYAFPSQQSEADFYGEDRAELIAINKILVALDLIEIKKEMVLRVDEQGHRWRVPHNLYRVKDTDDSRGLTTADVLRVTELAERDAAVYRHLRRVFSARFSPIDPANVWHAILPEVRQTPAWQRLAAKTAREEERFSARSKAGHASRRAGSEVAAVDTFAATGTDESLAPAGDTTTAETTPSDSKSTGPSTLLTTSVASSNDGSGPDVGPSNRGLDATPTTVGGTAVGPSNPGRPTDVAPSNTIEDQSTTTTTTTFGTAGNDGRDGVVEIVDDGPPDNVVRITRPVTDPETVVTSAVTTGRPTQSQAEIEPTQARGVDSTGSTDRIAERRRQDEGIALTAFEAANGGRVATPAEVQILRQLAVQIDPSAADDPELTTGWAWIAAAIYEAVDAGSAYVAPRRVREITARWRREGRPGAIAPLPVDRDPASPEIPSAVLSLVTTDRDGARSRGAPAGWSGIGDGRRGADRAPRGDAARLATDSASGDPPWEGPALWEAIVRELARDIEPDRLAELARVVTVVRVTPDEVELATPAAVAATFRGGDRPLLARALSVVLRRTVRLTIRPVAPESTAPSPIAPGDGPSASATDQAATLPRADASILVHSPDDTGDGAAIPRRPDGQPRGTQRTGAASASQGDEGLTAPARSGAPTTIVSPIGHDDGIGLSDAHLWAAVVDEVIRSGDVTAANVSAWLKPARVAGRTATGGYVVTAPSDVARRRLDGPLRPALEAALARVLGPGATFEVATALT